MDRSLRIKGFIEVSFLDWPGKVCSVVFLPGCNFRCPFCHNWRLWAEPEAFLDFPLDYILERIGEFEGWIDGVCISGGEPTLHPGLRDLILAFKRRGLGVKLDTNGSNPEVLEALIGEGLLDHVAMDVKAPLDPVRYGRAAGVEVDLGRIRRSLEVLRSSGLPYTLRTTVVPGVHREGDILELARQLRGFGGLVLQAFCPDDAFDPSLRSTKPYPPQRLRELQGLVDSILSGEPLGRVA